MAYAPLTKIPQQFFDNLGNPLVSGTLYAYLAGTSTPTNMYSDNAGTVAGTSVVLDSRGEPTTFKLIWLNTAVIYKFVLKDSTGTTIWTIDNISGDDGTGAGSASSVFDQQTLTATAGQTLFTLGYSYVTGTNAMAVYKNGSRLITGTDFTETSSTSVTLTMAAIAGDEYTFVGGQDVSSSFSSSNVSYTQGGTGAVTRSVQTKLRETVSVKDFGAVGDGTTDDTAAIQAALALMPCVLEFPPGTYIVSSVSTITSKNGFAIRGNGATIKAKDAMTVGSGTQLLVLTGCYDFEISDISFDGNRANRTPAETTSHLLQLTNCKEFTLQNVEAINATTDGFYLNASDNADSTTFTRDFVMNNCRATNAYRNNASLINTLNGTVIGGYFTSATGTAPQAGLDVESNVGAATPSNRSLRFIGVKFTGNVGYGLQLSSESSPEDVVVENCYFADNTGGGIITGIPVRIIGGQMESMSAKGVDVQSTANAHATIIGMEFKNFTTAVCVDDGSLSAGIALIGCRFRSIASAATPAGARFTATDCIIDTATGVGFNLSVATTRASLKGNIITGATGRAIYSIATDSEFIGNRAVDVGTVSVGYMQITGARCIVAFNECEASSAAATTIGIYTHHDCTVIMGNRCVNLHTTNPYSIQGTASATSAFIGFNSGGTANNPRGITSAVTFPVSSVANLPTGSAGMRAQVTDANATTFASIVAGGGANKVPVYHDGTNWLIG